MSSIPHVPQAPHGSTSDIPRFFHLWVSSPPPRAGTFSPQQREDSKITAPLLAANPISSRCPNTAFLPVTFAAPPGVAPGLCQGEGAAPANVNLFQFSHSVVLTLFDPMNRSTPGLPVHHQLLELTQTQVHRAGDAIQPSHPLLSPSPALNLSQHQGLF